MSATATKAEASGIRRKRDRFLVDALIRSVAAHGGKITPEACKQAIDEAWERPLSQESATEVIYKKLKNPNIRRAVAEIYEEYGEFTVVDAVKKHVEHIENGSYPALKDYIAMTIPAPARKLEISGGFTPGSTMLNSVPPVAARALGPATVEPLPEAQTVEFKDVEDGG
jgi:hypothetical protein